MSIECVCSKGNLYVVPRLTIVMIIWSNNITNYFIREVFP